MAAVGYTVIVISVSSIIGSPTCLMTCETARRCTAITAAVAATNSTIKMVSPSMLTGHFWMLFLLKAESDDFSSRCFGCQRFSNSRKFLLCVRITISSPA